MKSTKSFISRKNGTGFLLFSNGLLLRLASYILYLTSFALFTGFIFFENRALVVENDNSILAFHLKGGGLSDFHLKANAISPLLPFSNNNGEAAQVLNIRAEGTKLTEEEITNKRKGIAWDVVNSPFTKNGKIELMMKADMIVDKMTVKRYVKLDTQSACFYVKEEYYNHNSKEANLNIFQSIKLNTEFVEGASISSNVDLQHTVDISTKSVDLSKKVKDSEKFSWVIIANPKKKLILGYMWNSKDFPFVSYKQSDKTYLLSIGLKVKGPTETIPSGGNTSKSYMCFLIPVSEDFKGVASIDTSNGRVTLVEANVEKKRYNVVKAAEFLSK